MAYSFNGTNQYLTTASSPVTAVPLTIACWANLNVVTGSPTLLSVQGSGWENSFILGLRLTDNSLRFFNSGNSVSTSAFQPTAVVKNSWFHAAGVATSLSSRKVYYNYSNTGTSSTTIQAPTLINKIVIGCDFEPNATFFSNGSLAEIGIWNAALSAGEIASLSKGITCDKVRPQSLVFYAPLVRNLQDTKGGIVITNNNAAAISNHPRVYA